MPHRTSAFSPARSTFGSAAAVCWNWLGEFIGNTVGFIVTSLGNLWTAITGIFNGDWGQVMGALRSQWANIDQFFGGLPAKFMQFGIDMISGLVRGFVNSHKALFSAVSGIAAKVAGWFRKPMEINSPSRLGSATTRSGRWPCHRGSGYRRTRRAAPSGRRRCRRQTPRLPGETHHRSDQCRAESPRLPETGYLRLPQIIGDKKATPPIPALIPVGKSTWWAGVADTVPLEACHR